MAVNNFFILLKLKFQEDVSLKTYNYFPIYPYLCMLLPKASWLSALS